MWTDVCHSQQVCSSLDNSPKSPTEHVSLLVLTATLVGNIPLNAKIKYCEILNRVLLRINAADYGEALALMDIPGNAIKSGAKGRQREVVLVDYITIKAEI